MSYMQYLTAYIGAMSVRQSKHRGQRTPLSAQGFVRFAKTQRRRRAARKHSQRMNRK